jgi:hypothetical protein
MAHWLYNSAGQGVAYLVGAKVFMHDGEFLGELRGSEIWNGSCVGEIIGEDRVARKKVPPLAIMGLPGLPRTVPDLPKVKPRMLFPPGFQDLV